MSPLAHKKHILLADDDSDDVMLFREILDEMPFTPQFSVVHNGEQLMQHLYEKIDSLPHVLFLDLNMPRKNGFECLAEIRSDEKFNNLPVMIFSTSSDPSLINMLYNNGAHYYIRKPNKMEQLSKLIQLALSLSDSSNTSQPPKEDFVLTLSHQHDRMQ